MKPLSQKKYLENPNVCPACRGADITGGEINVDADTAWQEITCENCGTHWNDLYKLTGYTDLNRIEPLMHP